MPASAASPYFDQLFLSSDLGNETFKVETADLDQDGNEDLILLSAQSNQLAIFMGKGDGTFESVRYHILRDYGSDFAIGDFDGDGKLDLAVANTIEKSFSRYKGNGDGTFASGEDFVLLENGSEVNAQAVVAVDYNNNGQMDLMVKQLGGNRIWIYEQNGSTFAEAYRFGGNYHFNASFLTFADLNRDGYPDLLATSNGANAQLTVELHNGTGSAFSEGGYNITNSLIRSIVVSDFDGDTGNLEVATLNPSANQVQILSGSGSGQFSNVRTFHNSGSNAQAMAAGDFNGDGNNDLVLANYDSTNISILLGVGDRSFEPEIRISGTEQAKSVVAADFNKDGISDIAVAVNPASGSKGVQVYVSRPSPDVDVTYSTVTANPTAVTADNASTASITVKLKDENENVIAGRMVSLTQGTGSSTISPSQAQTNSDGEATFTVKSTKAETVTYTVKDEEKNVSLSLNIQVTFTAGDADTVKSTVTASPTSVLADGSANATVTVTLKDAFENPVPDHEVILSQGSGNTTIQPVSSTKTDANGAISFSVSSTTAQTVTYTATVKKAGEADRTLQQTATVTFDAGDVDTVTSTLTASTNRVAADGTASATLTVTLKDSQGNAISGKNVSLTQTGTSTISPSSVITGADGQAEFTVTHTQVQTVDYTAVVAGSNVNLPSVRVTFEPGAADGTMSTFQASPTHVVADGTSASTLTVHLQDQYGNDVAGHAVSLSQGSGRSTIAPATATTDASGIAVFTVSSRTAGKVTYTAKDVDENVTLTQTAEITFTRAYVPTPHYPVESVSLDRDSLTLTEGGRAVALQVSIQPSYASNQQVRWDSSDPKIATVDPNGIVTPQSVGTTTITVTTVDGNKTATVRVTVEPVVEESKLLRIETSPSSLFLQPGDSVDFQVKAVYEDGTEADITKDKDVTYKSSASSIAAVREGEIKAGKKEGEATITISYAGKRTAMDVIVSKSEVKSLRASYSQVVLTEDEDRELTVIATLSNGKKVDVTAAAAWSMDDPKVAIVEKGKVTAKAKGKTRLIVSYGGKTYRMAVSVVDTKPIKKLSVDEQTLRLEQGEHMELSVKAVYQDGFEEEITKQAKFQLKNDTIASLKKNELRAISPGKTTLTVTYEGKRISMSVYVIEERVVERLSASRYSGKMVAGEEQEIILTALHNDRTKENVTNKAEWTTSDKQIATVKNGIITAVAPGTVKIQAEYAGKKVMISLTVTD